MTRRWLWWLVEPDVTDEDLWYVVPVPPQLAAQLLTALQELEILPDDAPVPDHDDVLELLGLLGANVDDLMHRLMDAVQPRPGIDTAVATHDMLLQAAIGYGEADHERLMRALIARQEVSTTALSTQVGHAPLIRIAARISEVLTRLLIVHRLSTDRSALTPIRLVAGLLRTLAEDLETVGEEAEVLRRTVHEPGDTDGPSQVA